MLSYRQDSSLPRSHFISLHMSIFCSPHSPFPPPPLPSPIRRRRTPSRSIKALPTERGSRFPLSVSPNTKWTALIGSARWSPQDSHSFPYTFPTLPYPSPSNPIPIPNSPTNFPFFPSPPGHELLCLGSLGRGCASSEGTSPD